MTHRLRLADLFIVESEEQVSAFVIFIVALVYRIYLVTFMPVSVVILMVSFVLACCLVNGPFIRRPIPKKHSSFLQDLVKPFFLSCFWVKFLHIGMQFQMLRGSVSCFSKCLQNERISFDSIDKVRRRNDQFGFFGAQISLLFFFFKSLAHFNSKI